MAAVTVLKENTHPNADDDEAWLYGESENAENREPAPPGTGQLQNTDELERTGEDPSQTQEKYDDDDSDDDDDDVQVTIGDIKAFPMNNSTGTGLYKGPSTYQKQPVVPVGQKITTTNPGVKGVDVDAEGTINGVGVYEFSLDSLQDEDKPWRKPGADITDYFNYGFNEETWRKYCQKQNRLRGENGAVIPRPFTTANINTAIKIESGDSGFSHNTRNLQPKAIQSVASTGTIAVLGSTAASRRPIEEQINDVVQLDPVADDMNKNIPPPGMPPPMGMPPPDYSVPPPGMPPIHTFPPNVPPPGMAGVPPPAMFSQPPPVPFFPHPVPVPNAPNFGERPPFSYDNSQAHPTYTEAKPNWESRERESYRDREGGEDDEYRYSRSRDYNSRDYDRGDYYRSRDSDRSRSDRDRSRSRDRDRRHRDRDRDRDDKKSKSRKIKDEPDDSDYYKSSSSKHKKSKRSKRDKDDDRDGGQSDGGEK